jgi:hypothetical protein
MRPYGDAGLDSWRGNYCISVARSWVSSANLMRRCWAPYSIRFVGPVPHTHVASQFVS